MTNLICLERELRKKKKKIIKNKKQKKTTTIEDGDKGGEFLS